MPRKPKPETEIRRLKRELDKQKRQYQELKEEWQTLGQLMLKAQKEVDEWKRRFDMLLAREEKKP